MIRLPSGLLLALCLFLTAQARAALEDELLEPDKAFALSTRVIDAHTLEARWKIAPGYYMYRDKFKFEPLDDSLVLKDPVIPPGKKKDDPLFGVVETYTGSVTVRIPIERRNPGAHTARLRITSQGCNEPIGVCYPPVIKDVGFRLPALPAARAAAPTVEPPPAAPLKEVRSLRDLARTIEPAADEVVDPNVAFRISVHPIDQRTLLARFDIADCCYLYRERTRFELKDAPADVRLGAFTLPPGKVKTDEFVGRTEVYYQGFEVRLPVEGGLEGRAFTLQVGYQGCSEKGVAICYPPMTREFRVNHTMGTWSIAPVAAVGAGRTEAPRAPRDTVKFSIAVLTAFGVGLLLTFTPCVLPMIPILSSIIVGTSDGNITKLRGGLLSSTYVLGTAVTYTAAGVIAGATGEQLQAYFQNPWAIGVFATLLVLLALSMFGFYELQVPASLQTRLHLHAQRFKNGTFVGVFVLGLISALIIGACVSPLFISALGVAIANRDPLLGGAIMFSMALGMGVILIALGVGAGFLLPKAGPWMERVKQAFGVLLIAVAIYLLGFIPQVPVLYLWAALFIITGVYLGATQSLPPGASGWRYLWKGTGTLLLVWGILALLGGMAGNRDIFNPLPAVLTGGAVQTAGQPAASAKHLFERVTTLSELETRLAAARAAGRPVLIDYYADWCVDCLRMERTTFVDPNVRAALEGRYVLLQVDVTDPNDPEVRAMKRRFGVYGPPAMLFFAADGEERRELRTYGYRSAEQFLELVRQVG